MAEIRRKYIQLSKAWYSKSVFMGEEKESFTIQFWNGEFFLGEFDVNWYLLNKKLTPKLECWNDQWYLLNEHFKDFIALLASVNGQNITPEDFGDKLQEIGIENATVTENPYEEDENHDKPHVLVMRMPNETNGYDCFIKGWTSKPNEANIEDAIKFEKLKEGSLISKIGQIDCDEIFKYGKTRTENYTVFYLRKLEQEF